MEILKDYPLVKLNSFGIAVSCRYLARISSIGDLRQILNTTIAHTNPTLVIGGGSNILFTRDFQGLIILNEIKGIKINKVGKEHTSVTAGGGENWQDLVEFALGHGLGGIENLSLIPGSVGAAPIQNIGAYGVELKEVFNSLEAIDLTSGEIRIFNNADCEFGYRNSIFKNALKDKYFITKVSLRLTNNPVVNTTYGAISSIMQANKISKPSIRDVSNAVIEIRNSKLPNPLVLGNAGSFFKNPTVDKIDYEGLQLLFPNIPGYTNGEQVKIPAAWLIEQCEWKGRRFGDIGVHDKQPLVLVNYGNGKGSEISDLANKIQSSVADKFGISLEAEPTII